MDEQKPVMDHKQMDELLERVRVWKWAEKAGVQVCHSLKRIQERKVKILNEMALCTNDFEKFRKLIERSDDEKLLEQFRQQLRIELKYMTLQRNNVMRMKEPLGQLLLYLSRIGVPEAGNLWNQLSYTFDAIDRAQNNLKILYCDEYTFVTYWLAQEKEVKTEKERKQSKIIETFQNGFRQLFVNYEKEDSIRLSFLQMLKESAEYVKLKGDEMEGKLKEMHKEGKLPWDVTQLKEKEVDYVADYVRNYTSEAVDIMKDFFKGMSSEFNFRNAALGASIGVAIGGAKFAGIGALLGGNSGGAIASLFRR